MQNKNKIISIILFVVGILSSAYYIVLQIISPGTFLATITSFSLVWLFFGVACIFLAIKERKRTTLLWAELSKKIQIILSAIISLCILIVAICLFFILTPRLATKNTQLDYLIVLGGGITKNNTLTDVPLARIQKAAIYLKAHPQTKAIVTGGTLRFSPGPEAPVLKKALINCGIDESRIIPEDQAKDTIQNFQFSAKLIAKDLNIPVTEVITKPIAVITSDFHLARAERLASRMGFTDIYGISSKTATIFIPSSYLREIGAYIKLNLRILLTGKPTKLL